MGVAISTLTTITGDSTFVSGVVADPVAVNNNFTNHRTPINSIIGVLSDMQNNYASGSAPTDKPAGKFWFNSSTLIMQYYEVSSGTLRTVLNSDGTIPVTGAQTFSGQILLKDGTVSSPSMGFSSETNTGWYRAGANQPALTIVGTQRVRFNDSVAANIALLNLVSPHNQPVVISMVGTGVSGGGGIYPPNFGGVGASGAFGMNFSAGDSEVDYWNTYTAHTATTTSHRWYQLTGAAAGVLLMALDGNSNLLMGGITAATTSMTNGIMFKSGTAPSIAPTSGAVAAYAQATDAFSVAKSAIRFQNEAGMMWEAGGGAAKNNSISGVDLASYVSATGTAGADNTAQIVKSLTLKANSMNALGRGIRVCVFFTSSAATVITTVLRLGTAGTTADQTIAATGAINGSSGVYLTADVLFSAAGTIHAFGAAFNNLAGTLAATVLNANASTNIANGSDMIISVGQSAAVATHITVYAIRVEQLG